MLPRARSWPRSSMLGRWQLDIRQGLRPEECAGRSPCQSGLDRTDDRRPHREALWRAVPQAQCASVAPRSRVLYPAPAKAIGTRRCREAGELAPREIPSEKAQACRGFVMFGDEASFWLDGSLHRTWACIGKQPHVDTFGMRKTAHVFGAVTLEEKPRFHYRFGRYVPAVPQATRKTIAPETVSDPRQRSPHRTVPAHRTSVRPKAPGSRPRNSRPTIGSSTPRWNATPLWS